MYIDSLVVKVRDGNQARNKAAHLIVGLDTEGVKHVLGIWGAQHRRRKVLAGGALRAAQPRRAGCAGHRVPCDPDEDPPHDQEIADELGWALVAAARPPRPRVAP